MGGRAERGRLREDSAIGRESCQSWALLVGRGAHVCMKVQGRGAALPDGVSGSVPLQWTGGLEGSGVRDERGGHS